MVLRKAPPKKPCFGASAETPGVPTFATEALSGVDRPAKGEIMTHQPTDFSSLVTLLHARARTLRSCPQDAADLAQETALKVWQNYVQLLKRMVQLQPETALD